MAGYRHHASIERGTVDGYSGQMDMMGAWLLVLSNTGAWAKLVQAIMFRQMARLKSVRPRCRTKRCLVAATAIAFALSSPPMSVLAQSHPMSIDDVPVRSMQYGASEFSSSQQNMTELLGRVCKLSTETVN